MIKHVVKIPDPILRKKAQSVGAVTQAIRDLVADMKDTMYHEPGVGLAAPQIGVSLRVIVWDSPENEEGFQVFINPEIVRSQGQEKGPEACLSVPGVGGEVIRATEIEVKGMGLDGKEVTRSFAKFTARILQHEIDHTNGILYIDRLSLADRALLEKKLKKLTQSAPAL